MNVYEIVVSRIPNYPGEKWLVMADSATKAIAKAESKLKRAPRMYEGFSVHSCERLPGLLIGR